MAATEVKGQICDGPIAEIVIWGMFLLWCIHHYVLIVLCNFVICTHFPFVCGLGLAYASNQPLQSHFTSHH